MRSRIFTAVIVAAAVAFPFRAAAAADSNEVTLLRVFLTDGTSLVSYGEPARVSDRVVFSMPTASMPNPPLHLVNLPIARSTGIAPARYATIARASHYVETQAESDYAALSNDVAATLNEVAITAEPAQRLAIVQRARQTLADWPQNHYNYRAAEVRQLLGMLDEAIADLQASTQSRAIFAVVVGVLRSARDRRAAAAAPADAREAIEQVLLGRACGRHERRAHVAAGHGGRRDRSTTRLRCPPAWAAATRADARGGDCRGTAARSRLPVADARG